MTLDSPGKLPATTGPHVEIVETEDAVERRAREAYFTASQRQLIWSRFRKNRTAMTAGLLLIVLVLQLALLHVRMFTKALQRNRTTFTLVVYAVTVSLVAILAASAPVLR